MQERYTTYLRRKDENEVITTIISAISGLVGAIVGGILSIRGSKSATEESIRAQSNLFEQTRELELRKTKDSKVTAAKVIYIDILNSIFEGFCVIKDQNRQYVGKAPNLLPMNTDYSRAIVSLSDELDSEELVLINKIYGIMEKIRHDIMLINYVTGSYDT